MNTFGLDKGNRLPYIKKYSAMELNGYVSQTDPGKQPTTIPGIYGYFEEADI